MGEGYWDSGKEEGGNVGGYSGEPKATATVLPCPSDWELAEDPQEAQMEAKPSGDLLVRERQLQCQPWSTQRLAGTY